MIDLCDEVRAALFDRHPIVALESTIIAHGLPYPDNLELASELEGEVRSHGAVPATVAVIDGILRVGLGEAELERLARSGGRVGKASAADLAPYMARGGDAATTVSGTAFAASKVGIRLFATGGIGGVHRGDTGDVSADLATLASLPIAVVSAGAKSILDLPRTLEALETSGVLVLGYRTDELPAFYCRESGLGLEHRVDDPAAVAAILHARFDELGQGGVLIANPVAEEIALPRARVDQVVVAALARAEAEGVVGKRTTPFLLAQVVEQIGPAAIATNRALAVANATLAARVAVEYFR